MEDDKHTQTYANDSATSSSTGTGLTQPRSPSVHTFDMEAARRFLISERLIIGAETPFGRRCSNLVEQIKSYRTAGDPAQAAHLESAIRRSIAEIHALNQCRALAAAPVTPISHQ